MIELFDLCFAWAEGGVVIDRLSLNIGAGEKVVLLGANGCGKTTLVKLLDGLVFATSGSLLS
ncbi:ATP-binding cassette domain-containing protein [Accumulibacter sp.]|uniref:ATP-binding cassette domain-containing protein n=1 Tax=Accumulibacter sp. TaxID=2053492 RepID=UPI0025C64DB8|nr:ATP-binding cassette domain-containing protein [Accumulibacter sp.]